MPTSATVTPHRDHTMRAAQSVPHSAQGPQRRAVEVQREHRRGLLGLREVRGQLRVHLAHDLATAPAQSRARSCVPRNAARSTVTRSRSPKGVSQRTQVSTLAASSRRRSMIASRSAVTTAPRAQHAVPQGPSGHGRVGRPAERVAEVRAAEVRAAEVRVAEVRAAEVRAAEVRAAEVRGAEVRVGVRAAMRSGAAEVRVARYAPLRSAPLRSAPRRYAALRSASRRSAARGPPPPRSIPAPAGAGSTPDRARPLTEPGHRPRASRHPDLRERRELDAQPRRVPPRDAAATHPRAASSPRIARISSKIPATPRRRLRRRGPHDAGSAPGPSRHDLPAAGPARPRCTTAAPRERRVRRGVVVERGQRGVVARVPLVADRGEVRSAARAASMRGGHSDTAFASRAPRRRRGPPRTRRRADHPR